MNKEPKRILIILFSIIFAFMILIVYLTWFQIFKAETVKNNNYNKRQWIGEEKTFRGSFLDRNDVELAHSVKEDGSEIYKRVYNYGDLYGHIIGYSYRDLGKTGLESKYNKTLLGLDESTTLNEIKKLMEEERVGNSIKLTIDHKLQEKTKEALKGRKGAVISMNPKTGEIYSMVSLPDFNSSTLRDDWKNISENPDGPLLNRATQGLYEPGSTFKVVTATALLNNPQIDREHICEGTILVDGYTFKDYSKKGHGKIDLDKAITKSCNTYFIDKALNIGKDSFGDTAEKYYINKEIPFEIDTSKSSFDYKKEMGQTELAASGIGQGKVLMTPLNMLLITSTIANEGKMIQPTLIKEVLDKDGNIVDKNMPKEISNVLDREDALYLSEIMGNVVTKGTGTGAKISGIEVAGKTGTAENPSGKAHAWFIGFAPLENPTIATVVVLENDGSTGGRTAAPVAKEVMEYAIKTLNY